MPGRETVNPFLNADIRTPLFSADVLKKCALLAFHLMAEEGRGADGCNAPGLEEEWRMVFQRVQRGKVRAKPGHVFM